MTMKHELNRRGHGFTLVELLAVIGIMVLMMALIVPAVVGPGNAQNLTNGANAVVDQLNLARQTALATNRPVEVRFYYLPGPTDGTVPTGYRAMRNIVADNTGLTNLLTGTAQSGTYSPGTQIDSLKWLPTGVVIISGTGGTSSYGTLLPATPASGVFSSSVITTQRATVGTESLPGVAGMNPPSAANYAAIQFRPNGSASVDPLGTSPVNQVNYSGDKWFFTVKVLTAQPPANNPGNFPAANFVTVQIDPLSGRVRTFRP
jgi:uncharacterized protein (TIGR02596 family)